MFLGVSLSYLLVSCRNQAISEPGEVNVDVMTALPAVTISGTDYTKASLQAGFANSEIHDRFNKAYSSIYTSSLQESMIELISIKVKDLGGDGDNFKACLNSINNIKDKNYLPCVIESAKFEGKDVWILEFNWGYRSGGLGHIAYCVVEKSSQNVVYWESCK